MPAPRGRRGKVKLGARVKQSQRRPERARWLLRLRPAFRLRHQPHDLRAALERRCLRREFAVHRHLLARPVVHAAARSPARATRRCAGIAQSRGDLIARVLARLGCGIIRGSGAHDPARMFEKGAIAGFRAMKIGAGRGTHRRRHRRFPAQRPPQGQSRHYHARPRQRPADRAGRVCVEPPLSDVVVGRDHHQPALRSHRMRLRRSDLRSGGRRRCASGSQSVRRSRPP